MEEKAVALIPAGAAAAERIATKLSGLVTRSPQPPAQHRRLLQGLFSYTQGINFRCRGNAFLPASSSRSTGG